MHVLFLLLAFPLLLPLQAQDKCESLLPLVYKIDHTLVVSSALGLSEI